MLPPIPKYRAKIAGCEKFKKCVFSYLVQKLRKYNMILRGVWSRRLAEFTGRCEKKRAPAIYYRLSKGTFKIIFG
jgi:hypothetical protein